MEENSKHGYTAFSKSIVDEQLKEDAERLKEQKEVAKRPYKEELDNIRARTHQNGFESEADARRRDELEKMLIVIDSSDDLAFKEKFDFVGYMKDFATRKKEEQRERAERLREGYASGVM